MKKYINKIHYSNNYVFLQSLVFASLKWFSFVYNVIISTKTTLYKYKISKSTKLKAFVISIGNLTTGGTGKTPLIIEIANHLQNSLEKNVYVLSRGYGGKLSNRRINLISDGNTIFYSSDLSGDEPYLIAENTDQVGVITSKNRVKAGSYAINDKNANFLLLDDGYQYLKIARDLNILIIDVIKQFGNGYLVPAGPLRENLSAINRADKVVLVNKMPFAPESSQKRADLEDLIINKYQKPVVTCDFGIDQIYNIQTKELINPQFKNIYAFAAIAQPEFFYGFLLNENFNLVKKVDYDDHYLYKSEDISFILNDARLNNAHSIITTEKDAVKILEVSKDIKLDIPIFALKLKIELDMHSLLDNLIVDSDNNA